MKCWVHSCYNKAAGFVTGSDINDEEFDTLICVECAQRWLRDGDVLKVPYGNWYHSRSRAFIWRLKNAKV